MKKSAFTKVISIILAFAMILGIASVSTFAAESKPLLVMDSKNVRQGDEFEITIKIDRAITPILNPVAALDVTLFYNSEIYSVVSMENGAGIDKALASISGNDISLEKGYIFSASANKAGEVKWSFVALKSFTFNKGEVFAKIRFKANDFSDLNKNQDMTIAVTSAAAPDSLANVTGDFGSFTNDVNVAVNLAKMCDWEYVSALGGYRLLKFNGANANVFTIPTEYDDPTDSRGACPVVSIGSGAFNGCDTLSKVILGKNVAEVGTAAFFGCDKLEKLVVYSDTTKFGANSLYGTPKKLIVKCIKGSVADSYAQANKISVEYFENIADCTFTGTNEKVYYTGAPVELSDLKVYNSSNSLLSIGVDYTCEYSNNVELGTAKLVVTGIGEYHGTKTIEFPVRCAYHTSTSGYYTKTTLYEDCEKEGKVVRDCSYCGYHDESEVAPAKAHGETVEVTKMDSTCSAVGTIEVVCQDCKKVLSTKEIPMKDHKNPDEKVWVEVTAPTCGVAGKEVVYCADCETAVEEREIPALKHLYQKDVIKEPTCQETGLEGIICVNCKDVDSSYQKELPIVGHDFVWVVTKEPTCKEKGIETKQCRFCGLVEKDPAETREVPAKGCTGGEWVVTKEPTCEEAGVKIQRCVDCNELYKTDTIDAIGHTEVWITLVEETCTTGLHKVKHCSVCNEDLEEVKQEAPGHKSGEWKTITEYSCTQDGLKEHYCAVCNEVYEKEEKKSSGHKSGEWKIVEATCAKEGAHEHYCSVCDEVYESNPIAKKAHTPGDWETVIESSCTQVGMKHRVCKVCGEAVETKQLNPSGHGNYQVVVVTRPTFRFEGQNDIHCGYCGEYIRHALVKKLSADIDANGSVSASDALLILQHATGLKNLTGTALVNADLDGSGTPNASDALIVLQIATGLITA